MRPIKKQETLSFVSFLGLLFLAVRVMRALEIRGRERSCCQGYTQSRKDNITNSLSGSRQFRYMPITQTIPGEIASTKDSRKTKHSTTQI